VDVPTDINGTPTNHQTGGTTYKFQTGFDDILSASAVVYKDNWALADNESCNPAPTAGNSGFATGEKGIWRAYRTYAFLTDIKAGEDANNVNLRTDGAYKDFTMFNWSDPFYDQYDHGWKLMGESTFFNKNGNELESRDALGHYSAALFGYNGNLSTAVAANARYHEVAFDGFEEYGAGDLSGVTSGSSACHLDIVSPCSTSVSQRASETHSIISGIQKTGSKIFVIVNKEHYPNMVQPNEVTLNVTSAIGSHTATLPVVSMGSKTLTNHYKLYYDHPTMTVLELDDANVCLPNGMMTGQATLHFDYNTYADGQGNNKAKIVNDRAHTGKQSLYIAEADLPATFYQNTLRLENGKKYMFSAWVSEKNMKRPQFKKARIDVNGVIMKSKGRVIEGWQRVEGEFTASTQGNNRIEFKLDNGTSSDGLYIDDIRIFPKDGGILSYVYNPTNYRLVATLDGNNYATFYSYDSEGSVVLVRKETKEGVVTVQEGRSHVINTSGL
jgi:hypothetical protein